MRLAAGALLATALAWAWPAASQDGLPTQEAPGGPGSLAALATPAAFDAPLAAQPDAAEAGPRLLAEGPEAARWGAVGRLDVEGKGFCTGALIAPDLVLTAAHCLYDRESGQAVEAGRVAFRAGFWGGHAVASRRARRAVAHPLYVFDPAAGALGSARDLALVELEAPVGGVAPLAVAPDVGAGAVVSVVSYAVGRAEAPSREEGCGVLGAERGVLVLTCQVDFGASGAPILAEEGGVARIVSVVSAKGELGGRRVALGTSLAGPLAELRAALEALRAPPARALAAGERAETGALFVAAAGEGAETEALFVAAAGP